MREFIKKRIVSNFQQGLDELNISCLNYQREVEHRPLLVEQYLRDWKKNPEFDIQKFVNALTDDELLDVLDKQACQRYR
jgi:hypothetical protein